ncbi:hypothetical protein FACS1894139_09410 [Planctomycetales bacterium]|nr:hypothetical protein FACS1894107_07190 [Planctomycetales bacterium]GHT05493.1 hypothetical protein FACS1894139_09410 [Planctomycetales bacterium]GHV20113.1 hypothetical protein AGMMS49959_06740 [Planctomycetales bacterium]
MTFAAAPRPPAAARVLVASAPPPPRPQTAISGKRVLIAVGDAALRGKVAKLLQALSVEVVEAADGADARAALDAQFNRHQPVDLVLCAANLARLDSVGLMRAMLGNQHFAKLPVAMFYSANESAKVKQLRPALFAAFLLPLDFPAFLTALLKQAAAPVASAEQKTADAHAARTPLNFPYLFGGFPRPRNYALRATYYRCPFCECTFTAPRLIDRSLREDPNDFMGIGIYNEALERDFLHNILVEALLCPQCLYTADRGGMRRSNLQGNSTLSEVEQLKDKEWSLPFFEVNPRLQEKFAAQAAERLKAARGATEKGEGLFKINDADPQIPRLPTDALLAYDLAIQCANDILPSQLRGQAQARLRQKIAAYWLKQHHIYGLMIKAAEAKPAEKSQLAALRAGQRDKLQAAFAAINEVNDVEFDVVEEIVYCQTRRFFIADMLLATASDDATAPLRTARKKAFGEMKQTMSRMRREKPEALKVVERFLFTLENRMLDIEKEEKAKTVGNEP